jgi:molybdopterin synthase catalytic subunit
LSSRVVIQEADFNVAEVLAQLRAGDLRVGAVCSFVGTVRDTQMLTSQASDEVVSMTLEHYPGMTELSIEAMIDEAHQRFDFYKAHVVHRVGVLKPADQIVMVAVTSAHRGESFKACEFLMDYLKTQAPFWKKEESPAGSRWVDARVSDDEAMSRWGIKVENAA